MTRNQYRQAGLAAFATLWLAALPATAATKAEAKPERTTEAAVKAEAKPEAAKAEAKPSKTAEIEAAKAEAKPE